MQQSTDTPQLTTDAPQVTVLDTLRSVALPAPPTVREHPVREYDKGAYDAAHTALQQRDRIGTPAAWAAFGDDADSKPAIPKIPGQRKPSSLSPSAA